MVVFQAWPKTARLNKEAVYTEKIDGTNAAIDIERVPGQLEWEWAERNTDKVTELVEFEDARYIVACQSRKRLITPRDDNFGFAAWVAANAGGLVQVLGEGRHFGEWWGRGIQRGYGMHGRYFSLFNTRRWDGYEPELRKVPGLDLVPILYKGPFDTGIAKLLVETLRNEGSNAAPGFMNPEGVCVFHTASQTVYKTFLEGDDTPKGLTEAQSG